MKSKEKSGEKNRQVQAYTFILQFSLNMIVPIFACSFFGYWLDTKLGTSFIVIIGFFIGALSGFTSIFRMSRKWTKKDELSSGYPVVDQKKEEKDD
ncbi:MAG: AtpZ/AtpI family protein [Lachnospiraceae bacterium]|nr:AtpZ/AtpI family protein [Lachnospiraceae bacterium]